MERKNNLRVGLLSAVLTYSSLMLFIGPRHHFRHGHYFGHRSYGWHQHYACNKEGAAQWDNHLKAEQDKPDHTTPQANQ
jgi:hypothetical protein